MITVGRGTPLPLDCPPKLVVRGAYRLVRNPMAVSGLSQGMAVAIGFGSISIACYVVVGMVFWNYFVRPIEEADLEKRFGESYRLYRSKVKCWIPVFNFHPNQVSPTNKYSS